MDERDRRIQELFTLLNTSLKELQESFKTGVNLEENIKTHNELNNELTQLINEKSDEIGMIMKNYLPPDSI